MMSEPMNVLRAKLINDTAAGTDSIIARAILLATGEPWTVIDVAKRMHSVRYGANAGYSVIYLDGEPILELHDPHVGGSSLLSRDPTDAVYTLAITQNYKLLGKAAAAHNTLSSTPPPSPKPPPHRQESEMRVRKRDNEDRRAAFYDGVRIGEIGEDGRVIDRSAPDWFPALAREWNGVDAEIPVTVGDLIVKPDRVMVFVSPRNGFVEIHPGMWIVREGKNVRALTGEEFHAIYEPLPQPPEET